MQVEKTSILQNLSNINVELLLQDGNLVNGNEMVQLHINDEILEE